MPTSASVLRLHHLDQAFLREDALEPLHRIQPLELRRDALDREQPADLQELDHRRSQCRHHEKGRERLQEQGAAAEQRVDQHLRRGVGDVAKHRLHGRVDAVVQVAAEKPEHEQPDRDQHGTAQILAAVDLPLLARVAQALRGGLLGLVRALFLCHIGAARMG